MLSEIDLMLRVVYAMFMLLVAVSFLVVKRKSGRISGFYYDVFFFIAFWSALMKLLVAGGIGVFEYGQTTIYLSRYLDWFVATTMMIIVLSNVALNSQAKKESKIIMQAVKAHLGIILSVIIADFIPIFEYRIMVYLFGAICGIALAYVLFYPFSEVAKSISEKHAMEYAMIRNYLLLMWSIYGVVWLMGDHDLRILSHLQTQIGLLIIPAISTIGVGYLVLFRFKDTHEKGNRFWFFPKK